MYHIMNLSIHNYNNLSNYPYLDSSLKLTSCSGYAWQQSDQEKHIWLNLTQQQANDANFWWFKLKRSLTNIRNVTHCRWELSTRTISMFKHMFTRKGRRGRTQWEKLPWESGWRIGNQILDLSILSEHIVLLTV